MAERPNWVDHVFVGTRGHVLALNQETGHTVWKVSLPSTGYEIVSIVVENGQVLCGSGGWVFALEPETGEIIWSNGLPGLRHRHVFLATAQSSGSSAAALAAELAAQRRSRSNGGSHGG